MMTKTIVAIGAATINIVTQFVQQESNTHIVWIGSHQHDFLSANVRNCIGDIVVESAEHVVGTNGELLYIATGRTFEETDVHAQHDRERIERALSKYNDVYVVSSLGGGTTSKVTPFVAALLAKQDPRMQAVVTLPAKLEPRTRHEKAQQAFSELQQICPIIHLVTNNGEDDESLVATFARRDTLLASLLQRLIG